MSLLVVVRFVLPAVLAGSSPLAVALVGSAFIGIHAANPAVDAGHLYRSAMRIGREHIASTVDTLVPANAGAALPLLVVFTIAVRRLTEVITGEIVAEEVVKTLVGSIGLVASVPITTALACLLVTRLVPPPAHVAATIGDRRAPSVSPNREFPSFRRSRGGAALVRAGITRRAGDLGDHVA